MIKNEKYEETELKSFELVDRFLVSLRNNKHGRTFHDDRELMFTPPGQIAKKIIVDNELIIFRKPEAGLNSVVDISQEGLKVIKNGKIQIYLEKIEENEKQREETEQLELEISRNIVKDYPATKKKANVAFIIAIVAILFQVLQYFIK